MTEKENDRTFQYADLECKITQLAHEVEQLAANASDLPTDIRRSLNDVAIGLENARQGAAAAHCLAIYLHIH